MAAAYEIQNWVNGKVYIGSTVQEPEQRKYEHWGQLRRGVHGNPHLQNAWNKYGEDAFRFVAVLELDCSEVEIRDIETQLIRKARQQLGFKNVYTILEGTENPMSNPEVRARHQEIMQSEEWRNKVTAANRSRPQEWVDKMGAINEGLFAKSYRFMSPDGELVEVYNLNAFCKTYRLNSSHMCKVHSSKLAQHKGWSRCEEDTDE